MKDVKTILILVLTLVIIFLFTCNKSKVVTNTVTNETIRVDSVRITDTIVKTIHVPLKEIQYVHSFIDLSDTNEFFNDLYTYQYSQKDSLLEANILVKAENRPQSVKLEYDLKQFTIHDSIYVRDSTHTKEIINKSFLSVGATIVGNKTYFGFAPQLTYSHKKGNNYSLGYDVINGNIHVGFTKKLSFKKGNLYLK